MKVWLKTHTEVGRKHYKPSHKLSKYQGLASEDLKVNTNNSLLQFHS